MKLIIAIALSLLQSLSFAAAPFAKTQAPGYYRMMLGDFEVTAICDGTSNLPFDKWLHTPPAATHKALKDAFLDTPTETSFNAFVVNTGQKLVMIDVGGGNLFGPTLGNLIANLKAAGYQPEQIDDIYITHMHPDHIGGLGTSPSVFPNAFIHADKRDADYWLNESNKATAHEADKDYFKGIISTVGEYAKAGKLKTFDGKTQLLPGVTAIPSYGHTPGHTRYLVESKGQKLMLLGDLLHLGVIQFKDPSVTIVFDSDARQAMASRQAVFKDAAEEAYLVGAAHLQFPGLGHIRRHGKGYEFIPANYTVPR
ncbi:MBL fold metallo-hydrolase [Pseudoduganella sp. FT26W]|uniref:MBL fold metallo-hydrolase n=1 Tax=Duganella aquatilis TaxID=2666082 RepID=A0A844D7N4_9BURK|nr:MBL fold metallo-hydrolase [Duganella aquatilis]MRW84166.1 MBL fold metallo-hydrolase [Duganella aquatilis]